MIRFAFTLLYLPLAFSQDFDRTFRLTGAPSQRALEEISTSLRVVAKIPKFSIDQAAAVITIHAPANQVAIAEWLVPLLDHPPLKPQQHNVAGDKNDIVMVFPLAHENDFRVLQEITTTVRTVLDMQFVYIISSPPTLVLRGTLSDIANLEFLLPKLDTVPQTGQGAEVSHLKIAKPFRDFDTLTAYRLAHANSIRAIQEIITNLRTVTDIMKVYNVTSSATLALCANQNDTQAAEWLIGRLDRESADSAGALFKMPDGRDDVIQVLYLSYLTNGKSIASVGASLRSAAGIRRVYWMTVPAAVVVRGTGDAVAAAARHIKQADVAQ